MDGPDAVVNLSHDDPEKLAEAIRSALVGQEELAKQLREGAQQTVGGDASAATARRFQTILELGYLVASADGFAEQERSSLAHLLENITASAVDHQALELHFRDLDQAVEQLGRRERLARVAAELSGPQEAQQTIGAVATIALADGTLSAPEYTVLIELGEHLGLNPDDLGKIVDSAAERIKQGL
jgi:tellurite resistance protein